MANEVTVKTHHPAPWSMEKIVRHGARRDGDEWLIKAGPEDLAFGSIFGEANARLSIAAPDLLEVLQAYHEALHGCIESDCTVEQCRGRAAIEKATGGQA